MFKEVTIPMEINCKHFRVLHAGLVKGKRKNVGIGKKVAAKKTKGI